MISIFSQVFMLYVYVAIGFALAKFGIVKQEHTKTLSGLLVYVFLPFNIFKTFAANFNLTYISHNRSLLLSSVVILLCIIIFSHFSARLLSKEKYERYIYEYSMTVPNFGYMGYALAEALLGQAGLMNIMAFGIPTSIYINTYAFARLTKSGVNIKKIFSPTLVTTFIGIAWGLLEIPVPDILSKIVSTGSVCMAPVSMILTGITIAGFSIKRIISNKKIYPLSFLTLIVTPVVLGLILKSFASAVIIETAVLFYALPCGMNTVVFPRLVDENCEYGAGIALVSTTLACITLPIVLTIFGIGV